MHDQAYLACIVLFNDMSWGSPFLVGTLSYGNFFMSFDLSDF
jgi:hypothetical protein